MCGVAQAALHQVYSMCPEGDVCGGVAGTETVLKTLALNPFALQNYSGKIIYLQLAGELAKAGDCC